MLKKRVVEVSIKPPGIRGVGLHPLDSISKLDSLPSLNGLKIILGEIYLNDLSKTWHTDTCAGQTMTLK